MAEVTGACEDRPEGRNLYAGQFDKIYAMHGTIPVQPELIGKLIEGAERVKSGSAEGKKVEMFGNDVMLYQFPYAGFLCEVNED